MYLFLAVLGLGCYVGFSLVSATVGCYLVMVHELLIAVSSLRHQGSQYCGMWVSRAQAQ